MFLSASSGLVYSLGKVGSIIWIHHISKKLSLHFKMHRGGQLNTQKPCANQNNLVTYIHLIYNCNMLHSFSLLQSTLGSSSYGTIQNSATRCTTYDSLGFGLYISSSSSKSLTRAFSSFRSWRISFSSAVVNLGRLGSSRSYTALFVRSGTSDCTENVHYINVPLWTHLNTCYVQGIFT